MKKLLILLGTLSLVFTLSTAAEKVSQEMKCEAGKCAGATKQEMKKKCATGKAEENKDTMKCEAGKCGGAKKKAPEKGKCGEGKCG